MTLILSLVLFLPKILLGFLIANRLWRDHSFTAIMAKLAVGVPLGLWLGSSLFFIALLLNIPPQIYSRIEFWGVLLLVVLLIIRELPSFSQEWKPPEFSQRELIPRMILLSGLILSLGAFLQYARIHPHGFEDAWSIWNFTARFIYRSGSPDFFLNSEFYQRFHPDYPVELGLSVAWGWFVLGSETTRIPIAVSLLATYAPIVILWAALRRWKGVLAGTLGTLVLAMTLDLSSAVGQYADALLTLHIVAAVILFYEYLKSPGSGLLILAGLIAGSSAWVKNEGLLFTVIFSAACILAAWRRDVKKEDIKGFVSGLLLPLLVVLLYKFIVNAQSDLFINSSSFTSRLLDVARWQEIGQNFVIHLLDFGNWPVSALLVLSVYAALMGFTNEEFPRLPWLLLILMGQFAGYFFIYLITPHNLDLHIDTSIDRLISHVYPLLVFGLFLQLRYPALEFQSGKTVLNWKRSESEESSISKKSDGW